LILWKSSFEGALKVEIFQVTWPNEAFQDKFTSERKYIRDSNYHLQDGDN
jgi:hypothetical protein